MNFICLHLLSARTTGLRHHAPLNRTEDGTQVYIHAGQALYYLSYVLQVCGSCGQWKVCRGWVDLAHSSLFGDIFTYCTILAC